MEPTTQAEFYQFLVETFFKMLKSELPALIIAFILAGVAVVLGIFTVRNIAGWILFKNDDHLSIGKPIRLYDGRRGTIHTFKIFSGVIVKTEDTFKTIPWKEWAGSYETYRSDVKNRRKEDKCQCGEEDGCKRKEDSER